MPEQPPYALIELSCPTPVTTSTRDDPVGCFGTDMAIVHNILIRGVNSMWANAVLVKPGDERAFAGYCLAGLACIHGHHTSEEDVMFPYLQTRLDMTENVRQHEAFHDAMEELHVYMTDVRNSKHGYGSEKARALVEAFAEPLVQHLRDEIPTLSPEHMKVFEDDLEGMRRMLAGVAAHAKKQPGGLVVFPFALTHLDIREAPDWPAGMPWLIKWIMRNLVPWLSYSYWKFAPFTPNGAPQTYA